MTISSSLSAGVAGLSANANRLATIADNIANSSTNGYKRAVTDFHSMVVGESASRYVAGGVRTSSAKLIDERGSLVGTSNSTDLAVRGRGFLPVTSYAAVGAGSANLPLSLMTTGSFRPDADGILVTSSDMVLMGWPADINGVIPTYPRDTSAALQPVKISNGVQGAPTTKVGMPAEPARHLHRRRIGRQSRGCCRSSTTTTSASRRASTSPSPRRCRCRRRPPRRTRGTCSSSIAPRARRSAITASPSTTPAPAAARWPASRRIPAAPTTAPPATCRSRCRADTVDIGIGLLNTATGLTQLSDSFVPSSITKDGYPVSNLTSVEVDANGYVHAYYESGRSSIIYQIPLIDVPNPNGLAVRDAQTYGLTMESGTMFMWDAGDGPVGEVAGYAQEGSTTDLAGELTSLIQTQRAYSSNAKVIQTVDEMLQETTNIKR